MSTSPLDAILPGAFPMPVAIFPPASRYNAVPVTVGVFGGREVRYLTRRFLPRSDRFAVVRDHVVAEGERADHLAFAAFADPELSWLLADANGVMHIGELEEIGRRVRITLPEGIPGPAEEH
jgi:hypothetical protein